MPVVNQTGLPTLLDLTQRLDPKGALARIGEVLTTRSPFLQRLPWMEANSKDGHLVTRRTALPSLQWRRYNEGIKPSKSRTGQFTETCGMLEGISKVDVALAKRNGDPAAFRASEDIAFVQSYSRYLEEAFFYSNSKTAPNQIMGLSPRLDALSGIEYASQVIDFAEGAASGNDCSSIWLIGFGEKKVYGIYPEGSKAGLTMTDLGENLEDDGTGKEFLAYRTHFKWDCGLVVEDARYVVRIANIDANVVSDTGSALIRAMIKAVNRLESLDDCQPVFFMNRDIMTRLELQALDSVKNSTLRFEDIGGKPVMMFRGIPCERTDALLSTEAALT
jgi:hypothetical protein